ncbi:MAG TPA: hypothetical protein VFT22_10055 [Kofleriaceae bacterium]|nr:hypothetical protein [Kofleriaceae bacterium]
MLPWIGVFRTLVAAATTIAFLTAGCAGERPWPARPVAVSAQVASHGDIATIDVLPLDLQLWAEHGYDGDLGQVRQGAEVNLMNVALETISRRNYTLGAMIDWNGDFPGGNALGRDDLLATVDSLARYGAVAAQHPGQLPVPFLPVRLGTTTGADATLYLGGWSYVARHRESTGEKVAEGIAIGLLVLTVVAIIAILARDGKSHGGAGHHGGGASGSGGGRVAPGAGGLGRHGGLTASRGVEHLHRGGRGAAGVVDAFGRTAIDIALATPDWGEDPALPGDGEQSQMYLEMTLVDNHTGLTLWHAHQLFPASADSARETARAARTMLAQLPGRALPPPAASP